MGAIELNRIEKGYGPTAVLKGVSLDIHDGEFMTLIGPSGCGKSTLLRIIAGLEAQDTGDVRIGNEAVDGKRPKERDVAMVFQSYALYPHFTAYDNMALPLRTRRLSALQRLPAAGMFSSARRGVERGIRDEVTQVARLLEIEHLLGRKPAEMSGGQRQRVALGRAMVRHPRIFLMDEPLSNLDAKLRVQMRSEIAALHRRLGATFVYVTHDQAEAMTMSDRVAVMVGGEVLQVGPPEHLYNEPADLRVAELIGSPKINVVERTRCRASGAWAEADVAHLAFRAETARIVDAGTGMLTGLVANIENLGSEVLVHIDPQAGGPRIVVRREAGQPRFAIGAPVDVMVAVEHVLTFDAAGRRCGRSQASLS